eukprot:3682547-Rhodomonas_salina.1
MHNLNMFSKAATPVLPSSRSNTHKKQLPFKMGWGVLSLIALQCLALFWFLTRLPHAPVKWDVRYLEITSKWDPQGNLRETFSNEHLRRSLPSFVDVWRERPSQDSEEAAHLQHQFAVFSIVKTLSPSLIIESEVGQCGVSWFLRQAAPDARIILFDPHSRVRHDIRSNATVVSGTEIKDYSFVGVTKREKSTAVIIIDDDNSHLPTLQMLQRSGFNGAWVIYTYNFAPGLGKVHSLKKLWDSTGSPKRPYEMGSPGDEISYDDKLRIGAHISVKQHLAMLEELKTTIDAYMEFPPLVPPSWSHLHREVLQIYFPELVEKVTPLPLFPNVAAATRSLSLAAGSVDW